MIAAARVGGGASRWSGGIVPQGCVVWPVPADGRCSKMVIRHPTVDREQVDAVRQRRIRRVGEREFDRSVARNLTVGWSTSLSDNCQQNSLSRPRPNTTVLVLAGCTARELDTDGRYAA